MAEYFAITLAGNKIRDLSSENSKRVTERGDFSLMQETHVCLSLAKCFFGELIYEGMEICRRACGGHGFSHYSGLVSLVREYSPNNTHEGENTVLYLQVAKHLMKSYKGLVVNQKDIKEDSIKYIRDHAKLLEGRCKVQSVNQWTMA
jgi:acyl-CoA oxidase